MPKARPSFQAVPRIRMEPGLERNISVSVDQNRGFYLAEDIGMLAEESNGLSLMLRYQAHAELSTAARSRNSSLRPEMPTDKRDPFPRRTQTK